MLSFGNISIASTKNGEFDFRVGNASYPLTREDAQELVDWLNNKLMRPAKIYTDRYGLGMNMAANAMQAEVAMPNPIEAGMMAQATVQQHDFPQEMQGLD